MDEALGVAEAAAVGAKLVAKKRVCTSPKRSFGTEVCIVVVCMRDLYLVLSRSGYMMVVNLQESHQEGLNFSTRW